MIKKIKDFLKPFDEINLSQIIFALLIGLVVGSVLGKFGTVLAIVAVVADVIVALINKDYGRLLSKAVAYPIIFLLGGGLSKYIAFNANFSFIAIVAFSFTEIIGSLNELKDKFAKL